MSAASAAQLALDLKLTPPPSGDQQGAEVPENLLELFGAAQNVIGWALQAMEWAEAEIDAAIHRHPDAHPLLSRAFIACRPRADLFADKPEHVTRAHMREILDRIAAGHDLTPGTSAESCLVLAHLSLAAPLNERHRVAYEIAFFDAFGEERARATMGDEIVRRLEMDREHAIILDVLDEVKRQIRDEERGREWKARVREVANG